MKKRVEIMVNGKAYPCRPTMGAMLRFKRETGKEVVGVTNWEFTDLCTFLWCCIVSASKHDGVDFNLSLMDFADSITPEEMADWAETMKPETGDAKTAEDGEEKKSSE